MSYREPKFNQKQADHEIVMTNLQQKYALKMATLICLSVASMVIILCAFFGERTLIGFIIMGGVALLLGILSFRLTYASLI